MDSSPPGGSTAVNNPELLPPRTRHTFINNQSSSTAEENNESDSASKTIFLWKKLFEINILKGILEYHNENGRYPFYNTNHMKKFYKYWIEKQSVYVDEDAFYEKMVDLPERFRLNREISSFSSLINQTIEDWMDPLEIEIYKLSCNIWGKARDDDDDRKDSSLKGNAGESSSS